MSFCYRCREVPATDIKRAKGAGDNSKISKISGLTCLIECDDLKVFDELCKSPLPLMLARKDPTQLTASLRVIVSLAQSPQGLEKVTILKTGLKRGSVHDPKQIVNKRT
ncbi:hypothetical protein BS17DRAFT_808861 [Gyrodon lividus]|nr:hypothetical protein BS17DRAFT_808861 [Gyrodon lividus]